MTFFWSGRRVDRGFAILKEKSLQIFKYVSTACLIVHWLSISCVSISIENLSIFKPRIGCNTFVTKFVTPRRKRRRPYIYKRSAWRSESIYSCSCSFLSFWDIDLKICTRAFLPCPAAYFKIKFLCEKVFYLMWYQT